MFDEIDDPKQIVSYSFSYSSHNDNSDIRYPVSSRSTKDVEVDDSAQWPVILREFTNFLSGLYGYDISKEVFIKDKFAGEYEDSYYSVSEFQ